MVPADGRAAVVVEAIDMEVVDVEANDVEVVVAEAVDAEAIDVIAVNTSAVAVTEAMDEEIPAIAYVISASGATALNVSLDGVGHSAAPQQFQRPVDELLNTTSTRTWSSTHNRFS